MKLARRLFLTVAAVGTFALALATQPASLSGAQAITDCETKCWKWYDDVCVYGSLGCMTSALCPAPCCDECL